MVRRGKAQADTQPRVIKHQIREWAHAAQGALPLTCSVAAHIRNGIQADIGGKATYLFFMH